MISNLLLACGITLLPYQALKQTKPSAEIIDSSITFLSNPKSQTNIYEYTSYLNNELDIYRQNSTINFDEQIKTNISLKQRAVLSINREIANQEYEIVFNLLIEINTTLDREDKPTYLNFAIYTPEEDYINYKDYGLYRITALTTKQYNFLNGANYNSYNDIPTYAELTANGTLQDQDRFTGNNLYIETSDYEYYFLTIAFNYNTNIRANGQNLLNNRYIVQEAEYKVEYKGYINPSNYEVIDLPNIMFQILGMPFAWLSIAFDFTLFPNTAYAINISHILLGLIVSLIAIIIFKQLMKGR